ncbi:MAG: hypothetical protein ABIW76_01685 [Fibrobacteria bacterium]
MGRAEPPFLVRAKAGRLHTGLTLRIFAAEKLKIPYDNPDLIENVYKALLINVDASFLLNPAFDCLDAYVFEPKG